MEKKRKRIIVILISLAILVIPFVGFSLAAKGPAFLKSLSRIAGDGKYFGHLFIFGNLVIVFVLISIYYLFNYYKIGSKKTNTLFYIACILLEVTVLTPYIPEENPTISKVHNYCAYVSILLLVIALFQLIFSMPSFSRRVFIYTSLLFGIVISVCLIIFISTGRPSGFFELTLITSSVDLILLMIVMLHFNEKNKINGTLDIKYNIVRHKPFKIHTYEAHSTVKEPIPLILHEMNLHWKELKPKSKFNPFRKVFVFYESDHKKYYIGLLTSKNNNDKNCKILSSEKWAVFHLDDTLYTTKEHTWNYIEDQFKSNNEYIIDNKIYLEKYVVTKKGNIRKSQIWVSIKNND